MHPRQKITLQILSIIVLLAGVYSLVTGRMLAPLSTQANLPTPTPTPKTSLLESLGLFGEDGVSQESAYSPSEFAAHIQSLHAAFQEKQKDLTATQMLTCSSPSADSVSRINSWQEKVYFEAELSFDASEAVSAIDSTASVTNISAIVEGTNVLAWDSESGYGAELDLVENSDVIQSFFGSSLEELIENQDSLIETCEPAPLEEDLFSIPDTVSIIDLGEGIEGAGALLDVFAQ